MSVLTHEDPLAVTLATWVRSRRSADGDDPGPLTCELLGTPASGNSNVTLPFALTDPTGDRRELVLRLQDPANQIFLDADIAREFRLLRALGADPDVPSPVALWLEADPALLGSPFFVMERVPGSVPAGIPSIHVVGWLAEQAADRRKAAVDSALDALVAVHRFDWRAQAPFLVKGTHATTMRQRVGHLAEWYRWASCGRAFPVTDAGLDYLVSTVNELVPVEPCLLWGDARLGNVMFGPDARVRALLDWELASVGAPAADVAWWLVFEEFSTTGHGIDRLAGVPGAGETVAEYEKRSGTPLSDIGWFEILAAWAVTVTVIRMTDIAVAAGRLSPDSRMGYGNITAQMLARRLGLPVPDLDLDYARRRGL